VHCNAFKNKQDLVKNWKVQFFSRAEQLQANSATMILLMTNHQPAVRRGLINKPSLSC